MDYENIKNGIEEIKNIKMTSDEKNSMLYGILNSPMSETKPIKSPYHSFFGTKMFYIATVACMVIILGGGGVYLAQLQRGNNKLAQLPLNQQNLNTQNYNNATGEQFAQGINQNGNIRTWRLMSQRTMN